MAIFVHITDECEMEAKTHGFMDALNNFKSRVEGNQSISYFDRFPKPFIVKKKFGNNKGRLIASEEFVEVGESKHTVIVFLGILIRGSNDYEDDFAVNPKEYGVRLFSSRYKKEELVSIIEGRVSAEPTLEKPELTQDESAFLFTANTVRAIDNEESIFESEKWVQSIIKAPLVNHLTRIYDGLISINKNIAGCNIINVPNKDH